MLYVVYVIYGDYGDGIQFRTGPEDTRFRAGLWAHFYKRVHPVTCSCPQCLKRIALYPVPTLPRGRQPGRMYHAT